jgi:tripartite-type tricarboxylate transporter receptor subunit TctC
MKITKRSYLKIAVAIVFVAITVFAPLKSADGFPSKTIKFIVPYSAGGGQDQWARVLASAAIDHLGQAMHVQIRAGAGGAIGWRYLLDQPADGHTIMIGSLSPMIAVMTEPKSPIKVNDIKMVCIVSDFNVHMMALPNSNFNSWEKVVTYAKANPGKLTIGGTLAQTLGAASIFKQANLEATVVPYPGTSKAVADMLGGHINLAVVTPATVASLGNQAVSILNIGIRPDSDAFTKAVGKRVPWVGDKGLKGLAQPRWIGVHPNTPDDRVAKLAEGFEAIVKDKSTMRLITKLGEEVIFTGMAEANATYKDLIEAIEKYAKLLK